MLVKDTGLYGVTFKMPGIFRISFIEGIQYTDAVSIHPTASVV
jgi:hypothetical protein